MAFLRSTPGVVLILLLAGVSLAFGAGIVQVHRATHPARADAAPPDFEAMEMRVEEVTFPAADGVQLSGWLLQGHPERPAILLGHDRASSKASMLNLMIRLHREGFTTLTFDFRGHGESRGDGNTFGVQEKRDVLGAVSFLDERGGQGSRKLGAFGVGMGAHAVVLAAGDRQSIRVLVLDGLYPDAGFPLDREVFGDWNAGARYFAFAPRSFFQWTTRVSIAEDSASRVLPRLLGRHLLLVSPADDAALAVEMQRLYERIPEQKDADGNLITLPATRTGLLYGEDLQRYHDRIAEFFVQRLG
jgi:pimeloyl-ACP methyl ester carboxylesterase